MSIERKLAQGSPLLRVPYADADILIVLLNDALSVNAISPYSPLPTPHLNGEPYRTSPAQAG